MIDEFDDDTHYCIKCTTMIIGLDNYVSHRKTNCGKTIHRDEDEDLPKSPLPSQLLPPEDPFGLKADDFFSSLELQSSAKKLPPPTTGGKSISGVLTRSKMSVATASHKEPEVQHSKSGKNAWIGGHQLKEMGEEDNNDVDNLSRPSTLKKNLLNPYEESDDESDDYYYDDDSDSEEDGPPRHHTGGKWKPSSSPVEWNNRSWSSPPSNHTGGKWKPGSKRSSSPPPNHTKGKWKPSSPSQSSKEVEAPKANFTGGKWKSKIEHKEQEWDIVEFDVPPPGHTKGKWKPVQEDQKKESEKKVKVVEQKKEKEKDEDVAPSTHGKEKSKPTKTTGGKDKPKGDLFLRKSSGRVQYWCGACNRRLASRIVYERHLRSELHLRRSRLEEFDDSSHLNLAPASVEDPRPRQRTPPPDSTVPGRKTRRRTFLRCGACRARVHAQTMGKHLISHYHCRRSDINSPEARDVVLEHIHSVALQAPYQCACCRFYCNTQTDFLRHWRSAEHEACARKLPGTFSCAFCEFRTGDDERMLAHLLSAEHKEVISVINRSVPIVIRRLNYAACRTCGAAFLLNVQLRRHCERERHPYCGTATDEYQGRYGCDKCNEIFRSKIALQRHRARAHQEKFYVCSLCDRTFDNRLEAIRHRSSTEHRVALKEQTPSGKETKKKCIYCFEWLDNIIELKNHLILKHPEHKYSCPLCGEAFVISQELTVHLRQKSCRFSDSSENTKSCDLCPFSTAFESELIFHKILHQNEIIIEETSKGPIEKYKCPICAKLFAKQSLRCHLRLHTKERPYACKVCKNASFVRKSNWLIHTKKCGLMKRQKEQPTTSDARDSNTFLCSICGMSLKSGSALKKHTIGHKGNGFKCEHENCIFAAKTLHELKRHRVLHSDEKPFTCDLCDYTGKSKKQLDRHKTMHSEERRYKCPNCPFTARILFHLKRHARVHTGSKPFACPHCPYRSNDLENLRKHVTSTNKHPGKYIYECKFCGSFQCNFAKEFRAHLVTGHPDAFKTAAEAAAFVAAIFGDAKGDENKTAYNIETATPGTAEMLSTGEENDPNVKQEHDFFAPLYVTSKDICIGNQTDDWNLVEKYEEAGTLVTFESDGETLFEEI